MKYWQREGRMWVEKPEKMMECWGCGREIAPNPTLYCEECLRNGCLSEKEKRRVAKLDRTNEKDYAKDRKYGWKK